jgi:hypothetical protein
MGSLHADPLGEGFSVHERRKSSPLGSFCACVCKSGTLY